MAKETQQAQQELKATKFQIETVVHNFENELRIASPEQFYSLIRKSESTIASILKDRFPPDRLAASEEDFRSYTPQLGEKVYLKRLGDKVATVVEAPGKDETILVQYGKIRVRMRKSDIRALKGNKRRDTTNLVPRLKRQVRQGQQIQSEVNKDEVSYGPRIHTSKNTVDLRGMRVEEAALQLNMAISARESDSVIFIVHGMGTGAVKQRALEILGKHPRVAMFEAESSMNFGCTFAYIK